MSIASLLAAPNVSGPPSADRVVPTLLTPPSSFALLQSHSLPTMCVEPNSLVVPTLQAPFRMPQAALPPVSELSPRPLVRIIPSDVVNGRKTPLPKRRAELVRRPLHLPTTPGMLHRAFPLVGMIEIPLLPTMVHVLTVVPSPKPVPAKVLPIPPPNLPP